jgi:hypothetical protein
MREANATFVIEASLCALKDLVELVATEGIEGPASIRKACLKLLCPDGWWPSS